ncbi:MAG: hypothetical protein Q8P67_04010 [archaeon]|nr:hypothetical protein [archaeon]
MAEKERCFALSQEFEEQLLPTLFQLEEEATEIDQQLYRLEASPLFSHIVPSGIRDWIAQPLPQPPPT